MGVLERTAVAAAFMAFCVAPAASFGQAGPAAPPAGEAAPDAGTGEPGAPEDGPPARVVPLPPARVVPLPPDVLPPGDFGPGMGGRDCEHERSPGIGV
jgi:hypothetical protein